MAVRLESFSNEYIPAVEAFNARIASAVPYRVGTSPLRERAEGERPAVWTETLLVVEGEDVRGSVMLQHQDFEIAGARRHTVNLQLPISEGLVDRRYAYLGMWIIQQVTARYPFAFCVGMGGLAQPLPRLLSALRWDSRLAPFLFFVHKPSRFLRELPLLHRDSKRHMAATLAAVSGAVYVAVRAAQAARAMRHVGTPRLIATKVDDWGPWADEVWEDARRGCSAIGLRTASGLRALYPLANDRILAFRLSQQGRDVGWVALMATRMHASNNFGSLYVGTMLDALALSGYERAAACAVRRLFGTLGTDISIANHTHTTWRTALREAGYFSGPSNYVVALSKELSAATRALGPDGIERIHVTRGDGDGRLHL